MRCPSACIPNREQRQGAFSPPAASRGRRWPAPEPRASRRRIPYRPSCLRRSSLLRLRPARPLDITTNTSFIFGMKSGSRRSNSNGFYPVESPPRLKCVARGLLPPAQAEGAFAPRNACAHVSPKLAMSKVQPRSPTHLASPQAKCYPSSCLLADFRHPARTRQIHQRRFNSHRECLIHVLAEILSCHPRIFGNRSKPRAFGIKP